MSKPFQVLIRPAADTYVVFTDSVACPDLFARQAIARLISAAPELLAALRFVLKDQNSELDHEARIVIQDAINKAEGN